jgi:isochorismate hydrolase
LISCISHGRDQLLICGVYAHVGCLMTACNAFTHDIEAFLVADAVADFSWSYHELALNYAAQRCPRTPSTATVLAELGAGPTLVWRTLRRRTLIRGWLTMSALRSPPIESTPA